MLRCVTSPRRRVLIGGLRRRSSVIRDKRETLRVYDVHEQIQDHPLIKSNEPAAGVVLVDLSHLQQHEDLLVDGCVNQCIIRRQMIVSNHTLIDIIPT